MRQDQRHRRGRPGEDGEPRRPDVRKPRLRDRRNNHGHTVIAFVKNDGSVNLYRQEETDSITVQVTKKYDWNTDHKIKAFAIDTLKKDLKDGACVPHSVETYDELRTFVHGERGAMAAIVGSHDDRDMALSLANIAAHQGGVGEIIFG